MRKLLLSLILLFSCTAVTFAQTNPPLSGFDDSEAQYELGRYYYHTEKDYALAFKWMLKAARQDNAPAQCALAELCSTLASLNNEYDKDILAVSMAWHQKAADLDYHQGYSGLSSAYLFSFGTEHNGGRGMLLRRKALESSPNGFEWRPMYIATSMLNQSDIDKPETLEYLAWLESEAAKGEKDAYALLGRMYQGGHGVKRDYAKSFTYYFNAAALGHEDAQKILATDYTADGKFKDDYYELLANAQAGDAESQYKYSQSVQWPMGSPPNWNESMYWLKLAADQGHAEAHAGLISNYGMFILIHNQDPMLTDVLTRQIFTEFTSAYTDYNPREILQYIEKTAADGQPDALMLLGYMYAKGYIVEKNYDRALERLTPETEGVDVIPVKLELARIYAGYTDPARYDYAKARELLESLLKEEKDAYLEPEIYYELGRLYELGLGVPQDYAKAAEQYQAGLSKDDDEKWDYKPEYALALLYLQGLGVEQNTAQALQLFERAAEVYSPAQLKAAQLYYNTPGIEPDYVKAYGYALRACYAVIIAPETKAAAQNICNAVKPKLSEQELEAADCIAEKRPVSKRTILNSLNY